MIPDSIMFLNSLLRASYPHELSHFSLTKYSTSPAFAPELIAICLIGSRIADSKIFEPICSSSDDNVFGKSFSLLDKYNSVLPPPATIPSSDADLVAERASSILSFNSLISTSLEAPA